MARPSMGTSGVPFAARPPALWRRKATLVAFELLRKLRSTVGVGFGWRGGLLREPNCLSSNNHVSRSAKALRSVR